MADWRRIIAFCYMQHQKSAPWARQRLGCTGGDVVTLGPEGMLFDIGYADGVRPVLAAPETPVPDGTRAG